MVGIAGGLSRETPSPANASEPRPPAAEAAGRRGSFHAPATLRLDEAGGAACSTPYCSLARATPAHPQSHASAPRPPACSLHPLPPLLRISWSRTSPASVAALAVRRTAAAESTPCCSAHRAREVGGAAVRELLGSGLAGHARRTGRPGGPSPPGRRCRWRHFRGALPHMMIWRSKARELGPFRNTWRI